MDSWRLVNTARIWKGVPWMTSWSSPVIHVNRAISPTINKLVEQYTVSKRKVAEVVTLEHVTVTVNIRHRYRGNIMVSLVSPQGTKSQLATSRQHDRSSEGFVDWTFSTVRCWGENSEGTWKLVVVDNGNDFARGYLKNWKFTLYGSSMTSEDVQNRQRLVDEAGSGKYLRSNNTPTCPPPPSSVISQEVMSERTLKVILLFSGFCFLIAVYYILDIMFDRPDVESPQSPEEKVEEAEPSPLMPAKLAEEDWKRLSYILERGKQDQRRPSENTSVQRKPYPYSPPHVASTSQTSDTTNAVSTTTPPAALTTTTSSNSASGKKRTVSPTDESVRVKDFEKRLRYAMEQSLLLQTKQMNDLYALQHELDQAKEDSLLSHALHQSQFYSSIGPTQPDRSSNTGPTQPGKSPSVGPTQSIRKPLKGILKKGKSYLSSSR